MSYGIRWVLQISFEEAAMSIWKQITPEGRHDEEVP